MTMNGVKPLKSLFRQVSEWQLIVVAALAMGMASCSNNDNIIDIPSTTATPQNFSTFYVTVEAGIDDTYDTVGTTLNGGKVLDLGTIELVREDVAN